MLTRRFMPSLLLKKGRLVKGSRYRDHRDAGQPETIARAHNAQGADEMMLLDIEASPEGRGPDLDAIAKVAYECFMPLTVGGGIRSVEIARACMERGADKVILTMTALESPELITDLAHLLGDQAVVAGVDVIRVGGQWRLYDHLALGDFEGVEPAMRRQLETIADYRANRYAVSARLERRIVAELGWYLRRYGYV